MRRVCERDIVPAPAPTATVVPSGRGAAVAAVASAAAATIPTAAATRGPAARAQLDAYALAPAVPPVEVTHRVALQGGVGGRG